MRAILFACQAAELVGPGNDGAVPPVRPLSDGQSERLQGQRAAQLRVLLHQGIRRAPQVSTTGSDRAITGGYDELYRPPLVKLGN